MQGTTALKTHSVLRWDLPRLHYLLALLDDQGRAMLRPALWRQWQNEVDERAARVRALIAARSGQAGLDVTIVRSLEVVRDTAYGRTPGRTPRQALEFLARGNEAWRIAASVRTVGTYLDLTRLAYAVEVLAAGCAALHGEPGHLLITIWDPSETRILAEARAIAADAGLHLAAVGLYPLPKLLPSTGGSLRACKAITT
ncbi:hypothetical protein [Kibdelosporangium phytohabitans]|uniref:Uncharacterized protein n=1 Tax=Kibdelosporangium phytohabitans TaxID=860235 RepID=A0A0N7F4X7_9PSEU|nr:hypothetical protein [Kibdelosporangium phytohabitans]ALG12663.1 hypothetical protein AOZ06_42605 [Kibdelosporangium phytohabitans]MBE1464317.1 hypothetical protein [Kibdelosporangium phytohabitans]